MLISQVLLSFRLRKKLLRVRFLFQILLADINLKIITIYTLKNYNMNLLNWECIFGFEEE